MIKWDYNRTFELALTCKNRKELEKKSESAYKAALRNNWFDDYVWMEKITHNYTKEECFEKAKLCETKQEFRKKYYNHFQKAYKSGWLEEYVWFNENRTDPYNEKLDNVYAYFFNEHHSVYIGRTIRPEVRNKEHHKKGAVYNFAKEHNAEIPEMTILLSGINPIEGQGKEDYFKNEYKKEGWNIINIAATGIGVGSLGTMGKKWTFNKVREIALKYKTKNDFCKNDNKAYQASLRNDWLKEFHWFEGNRVMDYDFCFNEAKKYTTLNEMRRNDEPLYSKAIRSGWLKDYYWLKRTRKTA